MTKPSRLSHNPNPQADASSIPSAHDRLLTEAEDLQGLDADRLALKVARAQALATLAVAEAVHRVADALEGTLLPATLETTE